MGVIKVGDVAKTFAPVPVSSVRAADKLADVNEPSDVARPTDVTAPVRFPAPPGAVDVHVVPLLVSTLPLVPGAVSPVPPFAAGIAADPLIVPLSVRVPAITAVLPAPTLMPTDVPVPAALNSASTVSRSVLSLPPHVSRDAPTSGLVRLRLVV